MGSSASKAGAAVVRSSKTVLAKGSSSTKYGGASPPPTFLPGQDDALKNFKPTRVVDMSRPQARAAAKDMYEEQVMEMDPELLEQFKMMKSAEKAEVMDQNTPPLPSTAEKESKPRPLPQDRSRYVISNKELETQIGLLTQTQALELLAFRGTPTPEMEKNLSRNFHISREKIAVLLKYYRAPDVRNVNEATLARWQWTDRPAEKQA